MFTIPNKPAFNVVMAFCLSVVGKDKDVPSKILTSQDEKKFHNVLSAQVRVLSKEFPDAELPFLNPSSMLCFSGEKNRNFLLKFTTVIILLIIKRECQASALKTAEEYNKELDMIRKEIEKIKCELECRKGEYEREILTAKTDLLHAIPKSEPFCRVQERILDLDDLKILPELKEGIHKILQNVTVTKNEMKPFMEHIPHALRNRSCKCEARYKISKDKARQITDVMRQMLKYSVEKHISSLRKSLPSSTDDADITDKLIKELEIFVKDNDILKNEDENTLERKNISPSIENNFSESTLLEGSTMNYTMSFTPVSVSNTFKLKDKPLVINTTMVEKLFRPVQAEGDFESPVSTRIVPFSSVKKCPDSVRAITKRLQAVQARVQAKNMLWSAKTDRSKTKGLSSRLATKCASVGDEQSKIAAQRQLYTNLETNSEAPMNLKNAALNIPSCSSTPQISLQPSKQKPNLMSRPLSEATDGYLDTIVKKMVEAESKDLEKSSFTSDSSINNSYVQWDEFESGIAALTSSPIQDVIYQENVHMSRPVPVGNTPNTPISTSLPKNKGSGLDKPSDLDAKLRGLVEDLSFKPQVSQNDNNEVGDNDEVDDLLTSMCEDEEEAEVPNVEIVSESVSSLIEKYKKLKNLIKKNNV